MKKTGKALSLVLSMALVVSSLATTFASAATTKTEYLVTDTKAGTIDLVNGKSGSASLTDLSGTILPTGVSGKTTDHLVVAGMVATDVAHKSGDSLVSASITDNKVSVKLNSDSAVGTEVLAIRYTATSQRYTDLTTNVLFSFEKDYTIAVHKLNSLSVSFDKTLTKEKSPSAAVTGTVNKWIVDAGANGMMAKADAQPVYVNDDGKATAGQTSTGTDTLATQGSYVIKTISASGNTVTLANAADNKSFTAVLAKPTTATYLNVGSLIVYATPVKTAAVKSADTTKGADAVLDTANTLVGTDSIANKVNLDKLNYISTWRGATWAATNSTSWNSESDSSKLVPQTGALNITGCNVILDTANATIMDKGTIGTVEDGATAAAFTVNGGNVGAIDDAATVAVTNGTVGAITATTAQVTGGTTGAIVAGTATIDAVDEKVATHTGAISAATVSVSSSKAAVSTGAITEIGADGIVTNGPATNNGSQKITLTGSKVSVPSIDCSYYNTIVDFAGYTGTVAAPANSGSSTLKTEISGTTNTNATVTGDVSVDAVDAENGTLTFAKSLNVNTVFGNATIAIPAGALKVNKSINTVSLKLTDSKLVKGMTAIYAPAYAVYDGSFKTVGYTLDYDAVNSGSKTGLQPFQIKDVQFAAITIAPVGTTSNKIAAGQKVTYKVSVYPTGTSLPTNAAIDFAFSGSSDNFSYTTTADSITITAVKYDSLFSSLNNGTITATLVDKDTKAPLFGYDAVTYDVQMIAKPEVAFTSDTTGNLNKKVGETYQFKITSADGTAPAFAVASNGATVAPSGKSGNAYFYKVTPTKVGSFGVYVSGTKVAVLVVTSGIKCDTSKVTVAAGKTYQFKVTASAQPTFVVATVGAVKLTSKVGNDYFYKVTATKTAGAHGVYINGVLTAVITFA